MKNIVIITITLFLSQNVLGQKYFDTNYSSFASDTSNHINVAYDSASNYFYVNYVTRDRSILGNGFGRQKEFHTILYDTNGTILAHKSYVNGMQDTIFQIQQMVRYRDTLRCFGAMYFDSNQYYIFAGNLRPDMSVQLINYYAYPKNDSNYVEIGAVDTMTNKILLFPNRIADHGNDVFYELFSTPYVLEIDKNNFDSIRLHQIFSAVGPDFPGRTVSAFHLNNELRTSMQLKNDSNATWNPAYFNSRYDFCRFDSNYAYNTTQNIRINNSALFDKNGDNHNYNFGTDKLFALPISSNKILVTIALIYQKCLMCGSRFAVMLGTIDPVQDTFYNYTLLPIYNPLDTLFTAQGGGYLTPMTYDAASGNIYTYSRETFVGGNRGVFYISCLDTNLNLKWQHFVMKMGVSTPVSSGAHTSYGTLAIAYTENPYNGGPLIPKIYTIDTNAHAVGTIDLHKAVENITVYPNPSEGRYFFKFDNVFVGTLQIFTMDGKLVTTQQVQDATAALDISFAPQGQYIWKLMGKNNQTLLSNMIIKK